VNKISVYIIAYNEAEKISDCISSVSWADEVIVVDSHSNDGTSEIALSMGAKVKHVEFDGYGKLRNSAINFCSYDWIFSLDADERCTDSVKNEIMSLNNEDKHDIYLIPKKKFFLGKFNKYSGWYPNYRQPQLFRKGLLEYDNLPVHEGYISHSNRAIGILKNAIWQIPFKNYEEMLHKANRYSTLGVEKLENKGTEASFYRAFIHGLWAFFKHYIFKLGVLDGVAGFVIAFANFEGTFYRYLKLLEKKSNWKIPK